MEASGEQFKPVDDNSAVEGAAPVTPPVDEAVVVMGYFADSYDSPAIEPELIQEEKPPRQIVKPHDLDLSDRERGLLDQMADGMVYTRAEIMDILQRNSENPDVALHTLKDAFGIFTRKIMQSSLAASFQTMPGNDGMDRFYFGAGMAGQIARPPLAKLAAKRAEAARRDVPAADVKAVAGLRPQFIIDDTVVPTTPQLFALYENIAKRGPDGIAYPELLAKYRSAGLSHAGLDAVIERLKQLLGSNGARDHLQDVRVESDDGPSRILRVDEQVRGS
jgi:hypothetical protein